MEKFGSVSVWHNDSADAIFIGCCSNISLPWTSPVRNSAAAATRVTQQPRTVAGRYMVRVSGTVSSDSGCRLRTIHQAHTAATNAPAVRNAPAIACQNAAIPVGLVNSVTMLCSSARPVSGLKCAPTGCCMNEFAVMMKNADRFTAIATIQMQARCTSLGNRVQPKIHSPMKVDSKKNATRPSIASGAPKMSPTKREYSLQFIPNWNSWTMPVATPMAKLIRNSLPKNRVRRYHSGRPVATHTVCITAISGARPMVRGTKMKW
jgi:hypothetical protein